MNRVFFITSRPYGGMAGGAAGVNYKLYIADKKYKTIDRAVFVFRDYVFDSSVETDTIKPTVTAKAQKLRQKRNSFSDRFEVVISSFRIILYHLRLLIEIKRLREINRKYRFDGNDCYIFQDIESAWAFIRSFKYRNIGIVYHQQGSIYSEYNAIKQINSSMYRKYLDSVTTTVFDHVSHIAFPSMGAKEALLNSQPKLRETIKNKYVQTLYNGVDETGLLSYNNRSNIREFIIDHECVNFITVATLNYAKGVEKIPQFLDFLKKRGIRIRWYLVGNGIMGDKVEEETRKYGLKDDLIWLREYVDHESLMNLLKDMDFYVCFHRWSVFDFAIIESMALGVVPVLSEVGGNIEMIDDDTGFLVNDDNMPVIIDKITDAVMNNKLDMIRCNCQKRQKSLFSDKSFIEGYGLYVRAVSSNTKTLME